MANNNVLCTLTALAPSLRAGTFRAVVGGVPFPHLDYASAVALYESAKRDGVCAALTDEANCLLIRRTWGQRRGVAA